MTLVVAMAPLPSALGNPFIAQMCHELQRNDCRVVALSLGNARRADVLHVHWPDHFVNRRTIAESLRGAVKLLLCSALMRLRGRAVVWTVHNLKPHDSRHPSVERFFWPCFTALVNGVVTLSGAGLSAVRQRFPALRRTAAAVVPHGNYAGVYPATPLAPAEARESLGLPKSAHPLVFFGQIRPYKNVPELLAAFHDVDDPQARLVVAGGPSDETLRRRLEDEARQDPRVVLTGRVDDADVSRVFTAGVGVVLPYREVFNSGSLVLALSQGRPVLVPRTPTFAELRDAVGDDWVRFFTPPLRAPELRAFEAHAAELVASHRAPDLSMLAWEHLGVRIVDLYRRVLHRRVASEPTGPASRQG